MTVSPVASSLRAAQRRLSVAASRASRRLAVARDALDGEQLPGRLLVLGRVGGFGVDGHPPGELVEGGGERGQFGGAEAEPSGIRDHGITATVTGRVRVPVGRRAGLSGSIDGPWPCVDSTSAASPATDARSPQPCPRPVDEQDRSSAAVAAIIADVRVRGRRRAPTADRAVRRCRIDELRVPAAEIEAALARVPPRPPASARRRPRPDPGLPRPRGRHRRGRRFDSGGITVRHLVRPVDRAGCYAPGGRARYPSTVLMCAVPAQVAGVEEIVLCVPPGPDGRIDDATLAAAAVAGVDRGLPGGRGPGHRGHGLRDRVHRARWTWSSGPATATWPRPSGRCPASSAWPRLSPGPSEVVVIAGPDTPSRTGRHRPGGAGRARSRRAGLAVTWSEELVDAVDAAVDRIVAGIAPPGRPRGHTWFGAPAAASSPRASARARRRTPIAGWFQRLWQGGQCPQLHPMRLPADRQGMRRPYRALYRKPQSLAQIEHEATTSKIADDQLFYCLQRGLGAGRSGGADRQRLLQGSAAAIADGIRGRGAEAGGYLSGRSVSVSHA